jgi:uncharacterized protein (TIGR02452 family)
VKWTNTIQWAKQTVAICNTGSYLGPSGRSVDIRGEIERAKAGTILYWPETPPPNPGQPRFAITQMAVAGETTFNALRRLADANSHIACLNFASARNPGGGFLGGAQAQEESLARASALYPCLLRASEYYERNRANRSAIYLDSIIFSPLVPFFRDDSGALLEEPIFASVITAPAPNAGAVAQNEPRNLPQVEPTLRRRGTLVLQTAQAHKVDKFVLGAWGCGVFRNDPALVARIFSELLSKQGPFAGAFAEIVFAVYDRSKTKATYSAFVDAFGRE